MTSIERPQSLAAMVLSHLREQIVSGELELGSAISERQLAETMNVSKTPVRESLVQLKAEGLVTIRPQRGAFVFTLSAREVSEICEFRVALENTAMKLSLERNRQALLDDLSKLVSHMKIARATGDSRQYLKLDTEFHASFFRHCENHYLQDSYERYAGKIAALRTHLALKPWHTKLSFEEHIKICDALCGGADVESLLRAHIIRTRESYSDEVDDIAAADKKQPES
ncbi:MAG: GntR family transcriptional regulator [Burkholderiaceae bacterium]